MLKDINVRKVTDLVVAIVPYDISKKEELWDVYLINLKDTPIEGVIINAKGYGVVNGKQLETTNLKHIHKEIAANTAIKVEPIEPKVFDLTNQYWVSFIHNNFVYDKKYIFVPGSINEMNFTSIPILNKKGVMIR